jgi:hypothetical protein
VDAVSTASERILLLRGHRTRFRSPRSRNPDIVRRLEGQLPRISGLLLRIQAADTVVNPVRHSIANRRYVGSRSKAVPSLNGVGAVVVDEGKVVVIPTEHHRLTALRGALTVTSPPS